MSFDPPQPFETKFVGPIGPVTIDGIPNSFDLSVKELPKITIGVDPLSIGVTQLPKVEVGVDPLSVAVTELPKITVGLDPITIEPLDLNLAITKIPDVRAHFPANFTVGMSVLGLELFAVRLTGEAQVITEPYQPNPCEQAGRPPARPVLEALPPEDD